MNRMTKRFLSILMALVMVIALMPMTALATETSCTCTVKCGETADTNCAVCASDPTACTVEEQEEPPVAATNNIDAAAMTAEELKAAVDAALDAGYTAITVNLAEDADATMFSAITAALAADGIAEVSIDLTISGAKTVPECVFSDMDSYGGNSKACAVLRSITLTDATTIESEAFFNCAMTSFSAPKVIEIKGYYALSACKNLTDVYLPSVQTLESYVFGECPALKTISLPECVDLGSSTFVWCEALETVYAPKVTKLGAHIFKLCTSLTKVTLGSVESVNQKMDLPSGLFDDANDTQNIELILACDQKALSFDSSTKYWTATDEAFDFGNTNEFIGYTFKSITTAHTPKADDGDCTTAVLCSVCDEIAVEAKESHTTEQEANKANCQHGDICDECNTVYGEPNPDAHTPDEAIGQTCMGYFCTLCESWYGETNDNHTFGENGECACGADAIVNNGASLLLEGVVHVKQYYSFPNVDMSSEEIIANGGVDFYRGEEKLDTKTLTKAVNEKTNEVEFFVTSDGIPAKDMDKSFTMKPFIKIGDETIYGEAKEYGVLSYVENKIVKDKDTPETLKSTLAALLNYGAMAQKDLLGKTEGLMNECLQGYVTDGYLDASYLDLAWDESLIDALDPIDDYMTVNFQPSGTIENNGKSLFLKGAISVNYYKGIGKSLNGFENCTKTMYFWTEADYNTLKAADTPLTKDNASYTVVVDGEPQYSELYGYEWAVQSQPIAAKNLGDTLYSAMVIVDESGTEHCTGVEVYSPEQYASNMLNDGKDETIDELVQWMVTYGERAKTYFDSMKEAS